MNDEIGHETAVGCLPMIVVSVLLMVALIGASFVAGFMTHRAFF